MELRAFSRSIDVVFRGRKLFSNSCCLSIRTRFVLSPAWQITTRRRKHTKFKFVDKTRITAFAGKGGNGCISFDMPQPPKKVPSGGHGGQGGNVIIKACSSVQSLNFSHLTFNAGNGTNGSGSRKQGRKGVDQVIRVPVGTLVKEVIQDDNDYWNDDISFGVVGGHEKDDGWCSDACTEEELEQELVLRVDLQSDGEQFVAAVGGKPGLGNQIQKGKQRFHSVMEHRTLGQEGEKRVYELELKILADIGLVGFPNAGKSTLLGAVSRAAPTVGAYPFTTLRPFVGHVEYSDGRALTVADIPGLVAGAAAGRGLGLAFLRHVERARALAFVVDAAGSEGRSPCDDFVALQTELAQYSSALLQKPHVVLANKVDLEGADLGIELLKQVVPEGIAIFPISGAEGKGLKAAVLEMRRIADKAEDTCAEDH